MSNPLFSFGIVADVQYADKDNEVKHDTTLYYR